LQACFTALRRFSDNERGKQLLLTATNPNRTVSMFFIA
jgi:hypothetical protein